jgi:hypothetical protein
LAETPSVTLPVVPESNWQGALAVVLVAGDLTLHVLKAVVPWASTIDMASFDTLTASAVAYYFGAKK